MGHRVFPSSFLKIALKKYREVKFSLFSCGKLKLYTGSTFFSDFVTFSFTFAGSINNNSLVGHPEKDAPSTRFLKNISNGQTLLS